MSTEQVKQFDVVVCGSCTVDIMVRPVDLHQPLGADRLFLVDPIEATTGGIVSNAGLAFAKLGQRTAALTMVGDDEWGQIVRQRYASAGIDTQFLHATEAMPTSTTVVMISDAGQRTFAHCQGAPKLLDREFFWRHLDLFATSRAMLLGYYSLMPSLEPDLPEIFAEIRKRGCLTAMDAAGSGGTMFPLSQILPHLDCYVPSIVEARAQTGMSDPLKILACYRDHGAQGMIGVKVGEHGAILSPSIHEVLTLPAVTPPGAVVDTTGAGDSFFAGLLTGILSGMTPFEAGRLGAAVGACCVTGIGASTALRDMAGTLRLLK